MTNPPEFSPNSARAPLPSSGGIVRSPRGWTYLLGQPLGEGAYGAVFDCLGPFDQSYALKVFLPSHRPYEELRADWLREAERLFRLRHPNIVHVHDFFEADGLLYLVLERCDHSLESMLTGAFTDRLTVEVSRQLLFAIQYLADNEVVHNDLHAGNILVVQGGRLQVKLSDLGIAQDMYGQSAVRPPIVHHFIMAPEVAALGYTTKQSDLYQLGLLMFWMHTGQYPIDTSLGYDEVLRQIREGAPRARAEALGTPIGNVVSVMLRRQEQYRYTSAAQVWEDLRRLNVWSGSPPESSRRA
ncbi:MAG TPA: serine/threonine-protein kinase [Polyangiaceae bacterium]|nr:serine/threonine-protein kinase [Polyangiaceae bacterium]